MDEAWGHHVKWNKPITERQILYDPTYMRYLVKIIKTENVMVVTRGWGRVNGKLLFNRYRVSVLQDKKSYGDGWGDSYIAMWMYFIPLDCTFKCSKDGKFCVMCVLPQ